MVPLLQTTSARGNMWQTVLKQMSYNASLSNKKDSSEFSTSWWKLRTALYGSTTVSDTFGDGITENVSMIRSGYLQMTAAETDSAMVYVTLSPCSLHLSSATTPPSIPSCHADVSIQLKNTVITC